MKEVKFTRKELHDLVWAEPLSRLAKRYQITDTGLRKKCRKANIPSPPMGYWQKLKYGKAVPNRTPLGKIDKSDIIALYNQEKYIDGNCKRVLFKSLY